MGLYWIIVGAVVAAFDIALSTLLSIYLHKDYKTEEKFDPNCQPGHSELLFLIALLLLLSVLTAILFVLTPKNAKLKMSTPFMIVFLLKLVVTILCAIALCYPKEEPLPAYLGRQYIVAGFKNCTAKLKKKADDCDES